MTKKYNPASYKHTWPKITKDTYDALLRQLSIEEISIYDNSGIFNTFEGNFKKYFDTEFALTFSSGTASLHAAMVGIDIQENDEVICPAYTFYATVTPMLQLRAIPVLAECDQNGNLDPDDIEHRITDKTRAVIVTHMWGFPAQIEKIAKICKKNNLKLIEDCSHAHGARYKGKLVGTWGDVGAFSLQGQKIVTGGEGGIIITNDRKIFERGLLLGHYNKRCKQEILKDSEYYDYYVTGMGLKLRAHPFAIAMANEQFLKLDQWLETKRNNADYLKRKLLKKSLPIYINVSDEIEPSYYAFTITILDPKINTSALVDELIKMGVADADMPGSTCPLTKLKLFNNPEKLFPWYKDKFSYKYGDFPKSEKFFENTFKLPIDVFTTEEYKGVLDFYADSLETAITRLLDS